MKTALYEQEWNISDDEDDEDSPQVGNPCNSALQSKVEKKFQKIQGRLDHLLDTATTATEHDTDRPTIDDD